MSAGYRDYAYATLDILNTFQWNKIALVLDGTNSLTACLMSVKEICPEMHAYEIHELYDRHHKVSPNLNTNQNTNSSVKNEVIWKRQNGLFYMKYPNSG